MPAAQYTDAGSLAKAMAHNLREGRLDDAEQMYARLCELDPRAEEMLVFPVLIAIQRGRTLEALQYINGLPDNRCPELKALCLNVLGDPLWHGEASALVDSPNPHTGKAMRQLLCRPLND